jgi:glycosyltransferase involved in cell wall biosynthesis/tetratricopeptide (TPR) repeat protein
LIVRNEAVHLGRCLESVRELADEIVLVDTGSTDRTVEIARSFGARLFEFVWQDDFSLARNFAIARATGEWILSIDADESLAPRDHAQIRAAISRDDVDAFATAQRHYVTTGYFIGWQPAPGGYDEGEPYAGFYDIECVRLFRNRPALRFEHRVHESLASTDPSRAIRQARGGWVIHHFGKAGALDLLRAKDEAYRELGIRKVVEQPNNVHANYELGIQNSALHHMEQALESFERVLALAGSYLDTYLHIAICHSRLGRPRRALTALRLAARALPHRAAEIAVEEGIVHRALNDDAAAERAYRRAIADNPGLVAATINLAAIRESQNRLPEALEFLAAVLEKSPAHGEARMWRARIRCKTGDHTGALADLEQLGSDVAALRLRIRILGQQRRFREARDCLELVRGEPDAELAGLGGAVALGLGEVADAVTLLRRSLDLAPSHEAARNLSTALEAQGDRDAALAAAAEALHLLPGDDAARARFGLLAGDRFRRAAGNGGGVLTIFFCQPRSIVYDGGTPRSRGLGGTESGVIYLAEALARRGHHVVVLNNCDLPGLFDGVEYARWETLPTRCLADRPDVVVGVRFWETIGRVRLAPLQLFWSLDAFDQPFVQQLGDRQARAEIDFVMLHSDWQVETFQEHYQLPAWQILRSTLGSAASMLDPPARSPLSGARPQRLAYASTPFRGLDVLLEVFPRIRAACPDVTLEIFSSMQVYGMAEAEDRRQFKTVYRKARQPGVTLVGSLPQLELAGRLEHARILAYPNHYAETFCVAAAEAQAAGCAVVTSALGALPETVGDAGICIPGDPRSAAYQHAFVAACVSLLTDDDRWQAVSARALTHAAASFAWPAIAARWEATCRAALVDEPPVLERIAIHLAAGRTGLAQRMLDRETPQASGRDGSADDDAGNWKALKAFIAWRAGHGEAPSPADLQRLAVRFRSLRRDGVLEPKSASVTRSSAA